MGGIVLAATMDALGTKIGAITGLRVYSWPNQSPAVPAVIVDYPAEITYDLTFHRGADQAIFPVYILVGSPDEETSKALLSPYVSSGDVKELKTALEADPTLGGVIQTCRVRDCRIARIAMAANVYLGAHLEVEVTA